MSVLLAVLLLACLPLACQGHSWCVQLDVQGTFKDVTDRKPPTQQEMRDVISPVATTVRGILSFTCSLVDVSLGRVRYNRSGGEMLVAGSLLFTPLSLLEDQVEHYRLCVKSANILKPLNNDAKYLGKLRSKHTASIFLYSVFRDFCGPPIPIPPPDFSQAVDHKDTAILVFVFLFFEIVVVLILYLKHSKPSPSTSTGRTGTAPRPSASRPTAHARGLPGPSASRGVRETPAAGSMGGKLASIFNRKKPTRHEFSDVITNEAAQADQPSSLAVPSTFRTTEEVPKTGISGGKHASVFNRKRRSQYDFSDDVVIDDPVTITAARSTTPQLPKWPPDPKPPDDPPTRA